MKIFIKTLLFVFVTLITNPKVVLSANVAFLDIQETTTSLSFHKETPKTVFMVIENDWVNRCQNEQGFVAYRSQGAGVADDDAKGGTKLLSQFSKSTIDDATSYAMRTQNNIDHIFAAKHNLGPLVNKLGGQQNTINSVLNAANRRFPANGVF